MRNREKKRRWECAATELIIGQVVGRSALGEFLSKSIVSTMLHSPLRLSELAVSILLLINATTQYAVRPFSFFFLMNENSY